MSRQLAPTSAVVLTYRYFHLFWLFRVAFGFRYTLATLTEAGWAQRPLSNEEVDDHGFRNAITLHWWWRWGLLIAVGVLVLGVAVATAMAGR